MNKRSMSNAMRNERVFRALSYGLIFLIMACLALTVSILVHSVLPEWHSVMIAGAALLVTFDRLFTYRQLKSLTPLSREWAITLATQWIVILLVIRLFLSYSNGLAALREDLSFFARGYIDRVFTAEFVICLLLACLVWYLTGLFLNLVDEISIYDLEALRDVPPPIEINTVPAHQRMVNLVFTLGIFLVILTAMTRMNLRTVFLSSGLMPRVEFNRFSGAEAGALLYFVFGLALLSLSRLMSLQTHWNRMHIPISSRNLARQWGLYSLFFLLALGLIVGLLPSGDSFGLFTILGTLFGFLFGILLFLAQLIFGLILILFSLPFLFLKKPPPELTPSAPPVFPKLPVEPMVPVANNEILALIRSILLWGGLILILVFALSQFIKQHKSIVPMLRNSRITNWLLLAWQWLYRNVERTGAGLSRALADGWQNIAARLEGKRILPPAGLIRLGYLDPRRRVYFFYLAMIRRGTERGFRREPSQTPSEYAAKLEKELPTAVDDIDSITDAFIKARYTRQEVNPEDANRVKALWGRIRRALQSKATKID